MDVTRPKSGTNRKRTIIAVAAVAIIGSITAALATLSPALPSVSKDSIWLDQVRTAELTREVVGSGTLVPAVTRWVAASTTGRVERVLVQPGARVAADDIIVVLSDPGQTQSTDQALWDLRAAESEYEATRAQLEAERLALEADLAALRAEAEAAELRARADEELARQGLLADVSRRVSRGMADQLSARVILEQQRIVSLTSSRASRLAAQRALIEQRRALATLQQQQFEALEVRAGVAGVVQQVDVQPGQQLAPGTNIARVVQPDELRAEIRIAETQARDLQLGQPAIVDTRNAIVQARVARIDPAASGGTVLVDLELTGDLPRGARPDLNVDARIRLQDVGRVLQIRRPVGAEEMSEGTIFRLSADGTTADRVPVRFGQASVDSIQIIEGLREGDRVILSDTREFADHDQIRIR